MSDADAFRHLVSAYLDGELVGEDSAAFEAHVAGCAACRAAVSDERAIVDLLKEAGPFDPAPTHVRDRVAELLSGHPRRRFLWTAVAASAVAALLSAALLAGRRPSAASAPEMQVPSDLASFAARTHLHYTRGELPLDLTSDRADEVSGWFSKRVPFHLALPDYPVGPGERKPYHLAGGRVVSFKNDSAAFVAYRMGERPISLFVTSASVAQPMGGDVVASGRLSFHIESVEGLKIITWNDNGLTYALASDLEVEGSRSCLVCHGAPHERGKLEPLARSPLTD